MDISPPATSAGNIVLSFTPGAPPKPQVTSVIGAGTTNVAINFTTAIKGATYQVQYKNDLNDAQLEHSRERCCYDSDYYHHGHHFTCTAAAVFIGSRRNSQPADVWSDQR
jgi:hypothetical protein